MAIVDKNGSGKDRARRTGRDGRRARLSAEILERRGLLATIIVASAGDADGADGGSTLSLRQAIEISDGALAISALSPSQAGLVTGVLSSPNTIDFAIPGVGPFVIEPGTALPAITAPVVIDGDSEPGAHPNTNGPGQGKDTVIPIEIDGSNTPGSNGLDLKVGNSTVEGLAIGGFTVGQSSSSSTGFGILIEGQTGDLIQGDFLGTDTTGTRALPNSVGIEDTNSQGNTSSPVEDLNTIGGTAAGAGNVISGNTGDGLDLLRIAAVGSPIDFATDLVEGNFLGTDATGTRPLPNDGDGIHITATQSLIGGSGPTIGGSGSTIGGTSAGAGDVISGNAGFGIAIDGESFANPDGALVEGDFLGTDVTGTKALPDGGGGIQVNGGNSSTIGGTTAGARDVISGNEGDGISVTEAYAPALLVEGDSIGTDATGSLSLPNTGNGISYVAGFSTVGGTTAGAANVIAYNGGAGVDLVPPPVFTHPYTPPRQVVISGNSIFANARLGISNTPPGSTTSAPIPVLQRVVPAGRGLVADTSGTLAGLPTTTYSVEFFSNPTPDPSGSGQGQAFLGSIPVTTDASGNASFTFSSLPLGGLYISATATGPTDSTSAFSGDLLAYSEEQTTTTLAASAPAATVGQSLAFTATVTTPELFPGVPDIPTGQVTFTSDGVVIGVEPLDVHGVATFLTGALPLGSHTIEATYVGDDASSVSNPIAVTIAAPNVEPAATTTVSLLGPNRVATQGRPITFVAAVASTAPGTPAGPVEFLEDGVVLGTSPLDATGIASFVTDQLLPGPHAITAAYAGDPTHPAGASGAVAVEVTNATAFGGPAVTSDVFAGPDAVKVTFNRGLLIGPAQDAANYRIMGPRKQVITIVSAAYDPSNASVTLTTAQALDPHQTYRLTINGQAGERVVDVFGIALNGKKKGKPGHDYSGRIAVPKAKSAHPKVHAKGH